MKIEGAMNDPAPRWEDNLRPCKNSQRWCVFIKKAVHDVAQNTNPLWPWRLWPANNLLSGGYTRFTGEKMLSFLVLNDKGKTRVKRVE